MSHEISVVVPVYNRERLVIRCLDSILNQKVKPAELIVVDNNSTDSTYLIVEEWMKKNQGAGIDFKLLRESRKGACFARQKGLENAKGDYISFFDSDDMMLPDLIEENLSALRREEDIDIVCWKCKLNLLDGSVRIPPFDPSRPIENHLIHTLLRPQGYIVRKDFINKYGGWTKEVEVWDDFELGLRLLLHNPKITSISKILAEIFSQEISITGLNFSSKEGKWEKILDEMDIMTQESSHPLKEKIRKIINYRRAILAAIYYQERNLKAAEKLFKDTLRRKPLTEKTLYSISYYYTRYGFRGAWRFLHYFF